LQEGLILLRESAPEAKKLGLFLPEIYQLKGLRLAKQVGLKKLI